MVRRDRGAGLISSAAGVLVFLMFLMFAVQLLFGLYASSTVTAVANDAAQRAATRNAPSLAVIEADARANLGRIGDDASFTWTAEDNDGDGEEDTILLVLVAVPPRFVPASIGGTVGFGEVRRTVHARIETVRR
ncbi:MAG: hypothetical protein ABIY49_03715 [Acidimicrobiales bacterium]